MVCARAVNQGVVTLTITMGAMHSTRCGYGLCQKCFIPVRENGYEVRREQPLQ